MILVLNGISSLENRERILFGTANWEKKYFTGHHLDYLRNTTQIYWQIKIWITITRKKKGKTGLLEGEEDRGKGKQRLRSLKELLEDY